MPHTFIGKVHIESSPESNVSDQFLDRLIAFYEKQAPAEPHLSQIWRATFVNIMPGLVMALERRDKRALAKELNELYTGKKVTGMDIAMEDHSPGMLNFASMEFDAELMLTAIGVGVIPANCPCQEQSQEFSREKVVSDLEQELGLKLSHPGGARMPGARIGDRFMPVKMVEAALAVATLRRLVTAPHPWVAEIGGGVGFVAYLLANMGAMVTLIDLPPIAVIQAFLLSLAFGEYSVWLAGEIRRFDAKVYIQGLTLESSSYAALINQNSMPEMPMADVERYLRWIESNLESGGVFISLNHESGRGGQVWVHEAVNQHTNLRLAYRSPYLRRHEGWMQEVYVKA